MTPCKSGSLSDERLCRSAVHVFIRRVENDQPRSKALIFATNVGFTEHFLS